MSTKDQPKRDVAEISPDRALSLVKRSAVPELKEYGEYRKYLRIDFWFSCAYCTMTEYEAQALRFTIDHYEPQRHRDDLKAEYRNLMWCCDTCNIYKGDRYPSEEARRQGHRFFRPDEDARPEHFSSSSELRLEGKTNVGKFSIDAIELNRGPLLRLRQIRRRIRDSNEWATQGVMALRKFSIDQLPTEMKARAALAVHRATTMQDTIIEDIDDALMRYAKSDILSDGDEDLKGRSKESIDALRLIDAMFPGLWHRKSKHTKKLTAPKRRDESQ